MDPLRDRPVIVAPTQPPPLPEDPVDPPRPFPHRRATPPPIFSGNITAIFPGILARTSPSDFSDGWSIHLTTQPPTFAQSVARNIYGKLTSIFPLTVTGNVEGTSRRLSRRRSRQALPRISTEYLAGANAIFARQRLEYRVEHLATKPPIFTDLRADEADYRRPEHHPDAAADLRADDLQNITPNIYGKIIAERADADHLRDPGRAHQRISR